MKNLTTVVLLATSLISTSAFANGGKGGDPISSPMLLASNGGKGGDPTSLNILFANNGGKGGDPMILDNGGKGGDPESDDNGGKGGDPERQVITMDSGYPTLSALLSKYFSF